MPSLRFPDSGTRMVLTGSGRPALNARGYLYADDTLTTPAEVYRDVNGVKGALIAVDGEGRRHIDLDAYGEQPDYWGPEDGAAVLWIVVNGVVSQVHADYGRRIDALAEQVAAGGVEVGTGPGTVAAGNDTRITGAVQKSANLGDLADPAAARASLGLGAAATRSVGTAAGTVAAGDDARITGASQKSANLSDLANTATARTNLGLGNVNNTADADKPISTAAQTVLNAKAPLANPSFSGTVSGVTKGHVGLGNVDNTADLAKPISTAMRAALDTYGVRANDPVYGTPGTRAAFINCLDDAHNRGIGTVVHIPAGLTIDVVTGLSMAGRTCQILGAGAGLSGLTPRASVIKASAQTGPVLDFTDYVAPSNFMGKVTPLAQVMIQGSGVSDPTKNNAGIRMEYMQSATFRDIAIMQTGGPCLEMVPNPGAGVYLCDFERIVMSTPVDAGINDVPYFYANECNGCRFRGLGLRSITTTNNVGASGAAIVASNDQFSARFNLFDAWWYEFLHPSAGSTLFHLQGNGNVIRDFQWWDIIMEAGAAGTGTSYIRIVPPASLDPGGDDLGGNEVYGVIPGDQNVTHWIDTGVDVRQSRNRIMGTKGYRGKNVTIAAGVDYTYVHLAGGEGVTAGAPPAVINNSTATHNVIIDEVNGDEWRNGAQTRRGGVNISGAVTTYYTAGRYYTVPASGKATATIPNGDGALACTPFYVGQVRAFDRIGIEITTAAASTNVRLGIYADNGGGLPGALVLDAGTVDASTTGAKELTISTGLLAAGLYWVAAVPQGGSPTFRALAGAAWQIGVTSLAAVTSSVVYGGGSTVAAAVPGALPSTFPTINNFLVNPPVIALRAA
ncbi:hypothetical protein [Micromonospora tulbaghiae]|uniref:hypothetical protein n=1 Tax=Micromonospora tulbaghiae TaxID=479978 RepID=UPI0033D7F652